MSEILVTGGTGALGSKLVPRLVAKGHNVRVFSRKPGTNHVVGDLTTGDGVAAAIEGIDVLVHCATGAADSGIRGLGYKQSHKTDTVPTQRLVQAVGRNVHFVYISIVGVDKIPLGYYKVKRESEQVIENSGLPFTVLRTTQWHTLAEEFCRRLVKGGVLTIPKGVRMQLLDPSEVAERMTTHVEAGPSGYATDMGGPVILEFRDIVKKWLAARGKHRPVIQMPLPGKAIKAFQAGYNLTPDHADGTITFDEWLSAH